MRRTKTIAQRRVAQQRAAAKAARLRKLLAKKPAKVGDRVMIRGLTYRIARFEQMRSARKRRAVLERTIVKSVSCLAKELVRSEFGNHFCLPGTEAPWEPREGAIRLETAEARATGVQTRATGA